LDILPKIVGLPTNITSGLPYNQLPTKALVCTLLQIREPIMHVKEGEKYNIAKGNGNKGRKKGNVGR
jgi:hypothetical protein